jgi:hypothetical protein
VSSPDEFSVQHNREDIFSGLIGLRERNPAQKPETKRKSIV